MTFCGLRRAPTTWRLVLLFGIPSLICGGCQPDDSARDRTNESTTAVVSSQTPNDSDRASDRRDASPDDVELALSPTNTNDDPPDLHTEYYPDGTKFCQGKLRNGQRQGRWSFWFADGSLGREADYQDDRPHGRWVWYRHDGTRRREAMYRSGLREGTDTAFAADGETPLLIEHYREGQRDGLRQAFFETGQIKSELMFCAGIPHGRETTWYANGQKRSEGSYVWGRPDGEFTHWAASGGLLKQVHWRDGQRLNDSVR